MGRAEDLFDRLVKGGEQEVLTFISTPVTEELFLDYKRSVNNGSGRSLDNGDRANLAKAISGFGNSEGGIILWGVDCRLDPNLGDVPTVPIKIENPTRFKSWLEQATSGLTVPPHSGVRHHAIPEGFVVSLIPSGMHAPYQTTSSDLSFYIRAGSNFARAPHAVLAGLFGRRPQPSIRQHYIFPARPTIVGAGVVKTQIGVVLRNFGRGIAEDVFINLMVNRTPGQRCEIRFMPPTEQGTWSGRTAFDYQIQLITRPGIRLPPSADLLPITLDIFLANPIEKGFAFEGMCGCSGSEPFNFAFEISQQEIERAVSLVSLRSEDDPEFETLARQFNDVFFRGIGGMGSE